MKRSSSRVKIESIEPAGLILDFVGIPVLNSASVTPTVIQGPNYVIPSRITSVARDLLYTISNLF